MAYPDSDDGLRFSSFKDRRKTPRKKPASPGNVHFPKTFHQNSSNELEQQLPIITPPHQIQPQQPNQTGQMETLPQQSIAPVFEPSYTAVEDVEDTLDMRDYLGVILHRRYWLIVTVILVIILGFLSRIDLHPRYSSTSRLRIIAMAGLMDPLFGYDYISLNKIKTHMENLKSSKFLSRVVAALDTNISMGSIAGSFKVTRTKDANIINIQTTTYSSDFSSKLANVLAESYEKYDLAIKQKSFRDYERWITRQMNIRQYTLDTLESKLQAFYESNPSFYTKDKREANSYEDYDKKLVNLNMELKQLNRQQFLVKKEMNNIDSQIVKELSFEQPLKDELLSIKLELAKLRSKYKPGHFKIVSLEKKMASITKLIRNEAYGQTSTTTIEMNPKYVQYSELNDDLQMRKDLLLTKKSDLEELQRKSLKSLSLAPELELQMNQLLRKKQTTEKMYLMLQEKLQETQLKKSSTPREIFQMDTAGKRGNRLPKKVITFGASLIIGLILGIGLCFLVDFLDTTIRKSKDLQERFGLTLLGLVPQNPKDTTIEVSADAELTSPQYEPYRRLLANVFPNQNTSEKKSMLVTSALQGEGKTTTAAYLAITSALKGEKVLLIDADLRRHNIHNIFGLKNEFGLSDFINRTNAFKNITQQTAIPNLYIITSGDDATSMTQTLAKERLMDLITEAHEVFNTIIFDSPPILQLSDTLTLAPLVAKTLVVFRSKKTPIKAGEEVLRQLQYIQANVAGGVLNDVSRSFWDQYYYQYYKYGYSYRYGDAYS